MSGTSPTEPAAARPSGAAGTEERPRDVTATGWHGRYRELVRQAVPLVVVAGLVGSALIMVPESFGYRAACVGVATTCLVAGVLRLALPCTWVGVLAVRGRVLDAVTYVAAAVGVVILAFSVPLP